MTSLKTKIVSLSIDSVFRDDYYNTPPSSFVIQLPKPIENVIQTSVTAIEIPNFWYHYSEEEGTNDFTITVYNYKTADPLNPSNPPIMIDKSVYIVKLPDGNYNDLEMITSLNNYFINIGGGLAYVIVDIDIHSGKTTFRARAPTDSKLLPGPYDQTTPYYSPSFYYTLDFRSVTFPDRPIYINLGWSLGFIKPFYTVTSSNTYSSAFLAVNGMPVVTYSAYVSSEAAFGSSYYNYVFLDLDDDNSSFSSDGIISYLPGEFFKGNNIIARITIASASNSINLSSASDNIFKTRKYYGPVTIKSLNIRILDRYGELVNLNNNDFSFLIEFTILE
jgi:hypothetical protein